MKIKKYTLWDENIFDLSILCKKASDLILSDPLWEATHEKSRLSPRLVLVF